jgi:hypothetical protein
MGKELSEEGVGRLKREGFLVPIRVCGVVEAGQYRAVMRRGRVAALLLLFLASACAATGGARDSQRHDGFYGGVSAGATRY